MRKTGTALLLALLGPGDGPEVRFIARGHPVRDQYLAFPLSLQ